MSRITILALVALLVAVAVALPMPASQSQGKPEKKTTELDGGNMCKSDENRAEYRIMCDVLLFN